MSQKLMNKEIWYQNHWWKIEQKIIYSDNIILILSRKCNDSNCIVQVDSSRDEFYLDSKKIRKLLSLRRQLRKKELEITKQLDAHWYKYQKGKIQCNT